MRLVVIRVSSSFRFTPTHRHHPLHSPCTLTYFHHQGSRVILSFSQLISKWEANRSHSWSGGLKRCSPLCEQRHRMWVTNSTTWHIEYAAKISQSNRCWGRAMWCAENGENAALSVIADLPSLRRSLINYRCHVPLKGIRHTLLFTIAPQLSAGFWQKKKNLFCLEKWPSTYDNSILSFFILFFASSSREVQLKSIRSLVLPRVVVACRMSRLQWHRLNPSPSSLMVRFGTI